MARHERRHKTGIEYGHTYYTKNAPANFSEIKFELNAASLKSKAIEFSNTKLSAADRIEIKNNIRKSNKTNNIKC